MRPLWRLTLSSAAFGLGAVAAASLAVAVWAPAMPWPLAALIGFFTGLVGTVASVRFLTWRMDRPRG